MSFPYWNELITIGRCGKPHGLAGVVRVKAITDFPERFFETRRVFAHANRDPVRPLELTSVQDGHGELWIKFLGIDKIEQAEHLRGLYLAVPQTELVDLEEDEYWHWELEGLKAFSPEGKELGILKEVVQSPAHDLYLIEASSGQIFWVPAVHQYVPEIDIAAGRITIIVPEIPD